MSRKGEAIFGSRWWSVTLPDGWQAVEDAECVTLSGKAFPGAVQISAARKEAGDVTDEDLRDFAADRFSDEAPLQGIETDSFVGFYAEHIKDVVFWREWWLRSANTMICVSYNIDKEFKDAETEIVDDLVRSLRSNIDG